MKWIQATAVIIGGFLGHFLGGFDGFLYALVVFVVLDYCTGVIRAILERRLSSEVGFRGILKKVLIFCIVGAGHLLDQAVLGGDGLLRAAVLFFYMANEGISILENVGKCGVPIPAQLMKSLEQIRKKGDPK